MLKLVDLAGRADFDAGPLHISPGRRLVEGPGGSAHLEPIVMKVFLLLIDAAGAVVTRNELFDQAWGGVFVGDDSLNRAIARVRKIASETAPGLFEIETIPRTGYRLTGDIVTKLTPPGGSTSAHTPLLSRRTVMAGGAAAALIGTAGVSLWKSEEDEQRFGALIREAQDVLDYDDTSTRAAQLLQKAVALRPDDARAQGLLAYSLAASLNEASRKGLRNAAVDAEAAAKTALRIDPRNPDAKVARLLLERSTLDLLTTEDRLRAVLAEAPDNIFAMRGLWQMLTCVGRGRDALALAERATTIRPLSAASTFPLAQLLWVNGRAAEADRVIDRAISLWPEQPFVRWARFVILAFTNRAEAALEVLDRDDMRPQYFTPASTSLWRMSLTALTDPSPDKVERARVANLDAVKRNPNVFSRQALLCLPPLNEIDTAFEVAELAFLYHRPTTSRSAGPAKSIAWSFAPFLFVPPSEPMRADRRFAALADGIGLTAYWDRRGIRPDAPIAGL